MTRPFSVHPGLKRAFAAILVALVALPAAAQPADIPEKASTLVVYGSDPCPAPADPEEIVVCARRPESERYRIPEELREDKDQRGSVAWGTRFDEMEEATRFTRPNSCSVVGTWGQTGCFDQLIRNWRAERREMQEEGRRR
jgi:hypothetical protein